LWQQGGKVKRLCREVCCPSEAKRGASVGSLLSFVRRVPLLLVESLGSSAYPR
jgi:hypothetical protein